MTDPATIIKQEIIIYLDKGLTDKEIIICKVIEDLGVPRNQVSRQANILVKEMK